MFIQNASLVRCLCVCVCVCILSSAWNVYLSLLFFGFFSSFPIQVDDDDDAAKKKNNIEKPTNHKAKRVVFSLSEERIVRETVRFI